MVSTILVPLDGSEKAEEALEYAVQNFPDADLTLLHAMGLDAAAAAEGVVIVMDEGIRDAANEQGQKILERGKEVAANAGYDGEPDTVLEEGKPGPVIVEHADEFDTVVMGTHGRVGVGQKLLGSVAENVVRRSPVSVLVVK